MQTIIDDRAMSTSRYSFLTRPPPPQKQEPSRAIPSPPVPIASLSATNPPARRRASTIAAWAALVQPGSPAPTSPYRRLSVSSISRVGKRPSVSHSRASSSVLSGLVQPPSTAQDITVDLSAFGYTSVFAPKMPPTPSPLLRKTTTKKSSTPVVQPSSPKKASHTIKRFRSLNILRRKKSASQLALPSPTTKVPSRAETIAKHNKAHKPNVRPPPLANDIALMQFIDGGSFESNTKRLMEHRALATGTKTGVDDVYRDGKGGVWLDQDEEMEYAHLLGADSSSGTSPAEIPWVRFGSEDGISPLKTGIVDLAGLRRESVSTHDSDLDPAYLVLPIEDTHCGPEDIVLSYNMPHDSPFKSDTPVVPGLSVLSLPSRPSRAAKHLRKPEFLVDVAAFGPRSPATRKSPKCSEHPSNSNAARPVRTPKSARFSSTFAFPPNLGKGQKVKRRPAPLKLAPVDAGWKRIEPSKMPRSVVSDDVHMSPTPADAVVEASTALVHEVQPQKRGKVIIASLNPKDDLAECRELAGKMMSRRVDDNDAVKNNVQNPGNVGKRMKLGLGGIFGRK